MYWVKISKNEEFCPILSEKARTWNEKQQCWSKKKGGRGETSVSFCENQKASIMEGSLAPDPLDQPR